MCSINQIMYTYKYAHVYSILILVFTVDLKRIILSS